MNHFRYVSSIFFLSAAASMLSLAGCSDPSPISIRSREVYVQAVQFEPHGFKCNGYDFTVSPDEEWIVYRWNHGNMENQTVVHRRSKTSWTYPSRGTSWNPYCFSADSKQLYLNGWAATLSEKMPAVNFQSVHKHPDSIHIEGVCLDFPRLLPNLDAKSVEEWRNQIEERNGFADWNFNSGVEYSMESVESGIYGKEQLKVSPPGKLFDIDSSRVTSLLADRATKTVRLVLPDLHEHVGFENLSVSPNGKFLAAILHYQGPNILFRPGHTARCCVVIPLDREELVAYPLDEKVMGTIIWSRDSKAIYVSRKLSQESIFTIERLELNIQ